MTILDDPRRPCRFALTDDGRREPNAQKEKEKGKGKKKGGLS